MDEQEDAIARRRRTTISALTRSEIEHLCGLLDISTSVLRDKEFQGALDLFVSGVATRAATWHKDAVNSGLPEDVANGLTLQATKRLVEGLAKTATNVMMNRKVIQANLPVP